MKETDQYGITVSDELPEGALVDLITEYRGQQDFWVAMDDFKWPDHKLITFGASVCYLPVLINPELGKACLGHFPYSHIQAVVLAFSPQLRGVYHNFLDEVKAKTREVPGWVGYLFGGSPHPKSVTNWKRSVEDRKQILTDFSTLGFPVEDKTIITPFRGIQVLTADPTQALIEYRVTSTLTH